MPYPAAIITSTTSDIGIFVTLMLTFFVGILVVYVVAARRTLLAAVAHFVRTSPEETKQRQQQRKQPQKLKRQRGNDVDAFWGEKVEGGSRRFIKAVEAHEPLAADRGKQPKTTSQDIFELFESLEAKDEAEGCN